MINFDILIPAFNSEKTLPELLYKLVDEYADPECIIIVNDGSYDETAKIAESYNTKTINLKTNTGKGYAIRKGIEYFINKRDSEYLLIMDADLQHPTESIKDFISVAENNGNNFIIGMRKKTINIMPFHRILSNYITSFLLSILTGQKIIDSQCGFRLIHRKILSNINLKEDGFQIESEMLFRLSQLGIKIKHVEIPTIYKGDISHINNWKDTIKFIKFYLKAVLEKIRCTWHVKSN